MIKENVRIGFISNDSNFDWQSVIEKEPGYEFVSSRNIENNENPNWPKWSIIIDYKRNKSK